MHNIRSYKITHLICHIQNSAVQKIFELLNQIKQLLKYLIQFRTSKIIRNFWILTVTNFLLI